MRSPNQRGMSTLVVVIGLFFVVALAAAYANRHLLVEHRITRLAADDLRAQVAAEQGLEMALALLNDQGIDERCQRRTGAAPARERWLQVSDDGRWSPRVGGSDPTVLLCDRDDNAPWQCSCAGPQAPAGRAAAEASASALRVTLGAVPDAPGQLVLQAQGCAQASAACTANADWRSVDASLAVGHHHRLQVALLPGLRQVPRTALLAGGPVDLGDGMAVVNTDARSGGVALRAGGAVSGQRHAVVGPNGSAAEWALQPRDADVAALGGPGVLRRVLGLVPSELDRHPALHTLHCEPACRSDAIEAALATGARFLWLDGDLEIDRSLQAGSVAAPVLVVVAGHLRWTAPGRAVGAWVVQGNADLPQTGGSARLEGALVVGGAVRGGAASQLVHRGEVLQRVQASLGSFLRVPGSHGVRL